MAFEKKNFSDKLPLGAPIPPFSLPNVDGRMIRNDYFSGAKAALIGFTCNHCPYVKGSEEMLIKIVNVFESKGLKTITINSNDAVNYPEDSFEKMKEKAREMTLPYPYLYDESQSVARSFDAECTPEFFLFDAAGKLAFQGTINDSPRDSSKVTKDYLSTAIAQVLKGEAAAPAFAHPLGCSIKWKQ